MTRLGSILLLVASLGFAAMSHDNDGFIIAIDRSNGFTPRQTKAIEYYRFTVAPDGDWEFKPYNGEATKGTLSAEDLEQWVEAIEEAGLYDVESDPELGARDEGFMDLTVKFTHVRIRLEEPLSQAIEEKIVELVEADRD